MWRTHYNTSAVSKLVAKYFAKHLKTEEMQTCSFSLHGIFGMNQHQQFEQIPVLNQEANVSDDKWKHLLLF